MNFFKKSKTLVNRIPDLAAQHLKLIGIVLVLSATVVFSVFAIGRFTGTPQVEPQNSESVQTAAAEFENPVVNRAEVSSEPTTAPVAEEPIVEQTNAAERVSKLPVPAINKNPFISNGAGISRESVFNTVPETVVPPVRAAEKVSADEKTSADEEEIMLVALEPKNGPIRVSDSVRQANSAMQGDSDRSEITLTPITEPLDDARPRELSLKRARPFNGDVRSLPSIPAPDKVRFKHQKVMPNPTTYGQVSSESTETETPVQPSISPGANAPAPAPTLTWEGLGRTGNWGNGYPPDPTGDVGPNHYIQAINTALAIYNKSDGSLAAGPFSFDTFMSQGNFGNLCDTDNFGDPVVLYDTFEDRWIITDFAFQLSGGAVVNPPGAFQCFAVSQTSDPVSGGWNFYSIQRTDGLNDYPKFGVWSDGIYMSANMFGFAANGSYQGTTVWALNKAQMYAGSPTVQIASFNIGSGDFTLMPSNARLQTGTPAPGTPNYFMSTWNFTNALTVYKFSVNWNQISLSTFTGPDVPLAATSWPNAGVANAPQSGTSQTLDTLQIRSMMQSAYTNIGGVESLWMPHTVRRANTTGAAAPRWYQVDVTGGTVAATIPQAATWDPDANNNIHRFMPSLAVDRAGNMALGYTASGTAIFPSIRYAGRLATDPINTFSQTEQSLFDGTGSQTGTNRWGDYTHMTLDPDGCTFWYTNEYYTTTGTTYRTRIGSFKFNECSTIGNGILEGTVTVGGNPLAGATVALGSRKTTTDANGFYSFPGLPAGTYPSITASKPGFGSSSVSSIVVAENNTTTQNFSLNAAPTSGCFTDTTQNDFLNGEPTNVILTAGGDITLADTPAIDQQNTNISSSGVGVSVTTWGGQTFTPAVTGQLVKADINLFCSGCTGTAPDLTLSLRATSGGFPTGADLATATIPGNASGASGYYTGVFTTPPTLTAGTVYALVVRPTVNPSAGTYALTRSATNVYAGGQRIQGATSGTVWTAPLTSGQTTDAGFITYMHTGYQSPGNFVSGVKDANLAIGSTAIWGTLDWNATTPAGTNIQFQAAASNNPGGPWNFVGPDTTSATFFNNGDSLSQFNGLRYLRYKAILTTTDGSVSPILHDVTSCFTSQSPQTATTLNVAAAVGSYNGTVNLSATLTDGTDGISGATIDFTLNGVNKGDAVTDANGVATLSNVSLAGINAGSYPTGVGASFTGDSNFGSSTGSNSLTVNQASQTIIFGALSDKVFGDAPFTVNATGGGSGNPVTFGATGNCTSTGTNGSTITITGVGSCTVTASQAGDTNYEAAAPVQQSFNINAPGCNTVTIPTNINVLPNTEFLVPINVSDTTGRGILAYDFTLTYNPAVVSLVAVETAGTLSNGWTITPNSSSGSLIVSGFNINPLSGAGTLLNVRFTSVGAIGTSSNLNLPSFIFNEGIPCANVSNGSVNVIAGTVGGTVSYAHPSGPPSGPPLPVRVPDVDLNAAGSIAQSDTTDANGDYLITGFGTGAYTVTPSKTGQVNGITNFDATAVAQHVASIITLNATQQLAADVSGNGTISSLDASYIAQYVVSISNPGLTGTWRFSPVSRNYPNVLTNFTNENYSAILLGEVTGNWNNAIPRPAESEQNGNRSAKINERGTGKDQSELTVKLSAPEAQAVLPGTDFIIELTASDTTGRNIFGYEFDFLYDPEVITPQANPCDSAGTLSDMSAGRTVLCNPVSPGLLRVVMFSSTGVPVSGEGVSLKLRFTAVGAGGASTRLKFENFMFNEGIPGEAAIDGEVKIAPTRQPRQR